MQNVSERSSASHMWFSTAHFQVVSRHTKPHAMPEVGSQQASCGLADFRSSRRWAHACGDGWKVSSSQSGQRAGRMSRTDTLFFSCTFTSRPASSKIFTDFLAGFTFNNRVLRLPALIVLLTLINAGRRRTLLLKLEDGPVVYPANAFDSRLRGD